MNRYYQVGHPPLYVTFFRPPVRLSVRPSVAHHISGTVYHLIIIFSTHVQTDDISRYFFHTFEILIFWVVRGQKCKKQPKMKNENYICHVPYLRNSIAYDHDFWYICVNDDISRRFFHLLGCQSGKRTKLAQNEKQQLHPSRAKSQEKYSI